jgi:tetratricopeptide (TPR) repeat protein
MWFPGFHRVVGWRLNRAIRNSDLERAERIAAAYARWRPRDPQAWLMWASVVLKAGGPPPPTPSGPIERLVEIERVLRRGLEFHPNSINLSAELASMVSHQERYEEAEQIWSDLRARHPESPVPYAGLARLAATWGRYEQCKDLAEEAIKRNPDSETTENLASSLLYVPGERHRAMELLERAVKDTHNPATHVLLALLVEETDPARAQAHLAKAAQHLPRGSEDLEREITRTRAVLTNYPLPDP